MSYIRDFELNGLLGIFLYWVPLLFCAVFYTVRSAQGYMQDKKDRRERLRFYVPSETVGSLIGRALVSVLPVANIWAALFDLAPDVFGRLFRLIGKVFSQPLVPDNEATKADRAKGEQP